MSATATDLSTHSSAAPARAQRSDFGTEAALLAEHGWRVFPLRDCDAPGDDRKRPRPGFTEWQNRATTNEDRIAEWWGNWPKANIAVVMGERSGIIDIEADSDDAERLLLELFDGYELHTPTFRSARGKHRLFRFAPDIPNSDKAHWKIPGTDLDFKCGGGGGTYCLFPPSIHPSGKPYRWLISPDEAEPMEIPAEVIARLLVRLQEGENQQAGDRDWNAVEQGVKEGDRNDSAAAYVGKLASGMADPHDEIETAALRRKILEWNQRNDPPLPEQEVEKTVRSILGRERAKRGPAIAVGDYKLHLIAARKTDKKEIATVRISRGTCELDEIEITSSSHGRKQAAKDLSSLIGCDSGDAGNAVRRALVQVRQVLRRQAEAEAGGTTIRDIIREKVPARFDLQYKTDKGAWSESRRAVVSRGEFITFVPGWLVELCETASDVPRRQDGSIVAKNVLSAAKAELEILWATTVDTLPVCESDATALSDKSEAARKFRAAFEGMLLKPQTWEKTTNTSNNNEIARRTHIVERLNYRIGHEEYIIKGEKKWHRVQPAFEAWCRYSDDGRLFMAIRYTLANQIGVTLPGVGDATSLKKLMGRYGLLETNPPSDIPDRLTKGRRIAIVKAEYLERLRDVEGSE